nr:hypothetical protein [Tanacetum cinerariifolium]
MEIEEVSERYIEPCFVNGLESYDGEINIELDKNMISNEFTVKLCLKHEVKDGDKVVKRELIVALRGPSLTNRKPLTQEEAAHEAISIDIYKMISILEEARPIIKTLTYNDWYKKILDNILLDKLKLDSEIKSEEDKGRDEIKPVNRGITMLNHSKEEPMGVLKDVLCHVGVTTVIEKFLILDMPMDKKVKENSKKTKSNQNRTKTRSVAKQGEVKISYNR